MSNHSERGGNPEEEQLQKEYKKTVDELEILYSQGRFLQKKLEDAIEKSSRQKIVEKIKNIKETE